MVNLACSGNPDWAFSQGHYYFIPGDSDSGKTFLGLTCFAEATIDPNFDDYRLIYDGTEEGAIMDIKRFFGAKVFERIESPSVDADGLPKNSTTVESFYFNVWDALEDGRPFIYIVDSQDALTSEAEEKAFDKHKAVHDQGKQLDKGTYSDGKSKVHSAKLRKVVSRLKKAKSILIIINQTRDSFDMFTPSTYSGGRALKFYATLQLWLSVKGQIKKSYHGKDRQQGVFCKVRIRKNRQNGRDRTVIVPIYHSVGIDDIGGCIDYLLDEKYWKANGGVIAVTGLGPEQKMKRENLVQWIEEEEMEPDLRDLVTQVWNQIEDACKVERKSRYE